MIELLHVMVAGAGILVTVFVVYGALIRVVYDAVKELQQRFFGAETDETDNGFVGETNERLHRIERTQDAIREENRQQSRLMTSIAYGIEDLVQALNKTEDVDVDLDHVRLRDDFYRGGGSSSSSGDSSSSNKNNSGTNPGDPVTDGSGLAIFRTTLPHAPWHPSPPDLENEDWTATYCYK